MFLTNQFLKPIFLSSFFLFFFYSFIHLFIYLFFFSFSIVSKSNFLLNLKINLLSSLPPLTQTTYEFYFLVIQWNERNKYSISRKNESFSFLRWVEKKIATFKKKKMKLIGTALLTRAINYKSSSFFQLATGEIVRHDRKNSIENKDANCKFIWKNLLLSSPMIHRKKCPNDENEGEKAPISLHEK